MVLPEGFALPRLPYLVALLVGLGAVAYGFRERRPAVTERRILALAPWMLAGAALHVLYVVDAVPGVVAPLLGTPAVYLSVAVVAGAIWLAADAAGRDVERFLAGSGTVAFAVGLVAALAIGAARGTLSPFWPAIAAVVGLGVGAATWLGLRRALPRVTVAGDVGALVVLAHALDGVSTAVGVDLLGYGERTPLSRLILDLAADLPTADLVGAGWLFVLVKLLVAAFVLVLLVDVVEAEPAEGYALLGLVAAVGLGPAVHNLLLFTVAA